MQDIPRFFREHAESCRALGSPLTAALLAGLADALRPGTPVADRIFDWPGDASVRRDAVALRLAGALHALVLSGRDAALAREYATPGPNLIPAALAAIAAHQDHVMHWLDSAPQTNEVRRSVALIAAGHWLDARFGLPLVLSELGCSAGLNLIWDRFAMQAGGAVWGPPDPVLLLTPELRGAAPPQAAPRVAARSGVDLNPLDAQADRLRILSYIWADQADRLDRTARAATEVARLRPPLMRADAVDWLETRLQTPMPGHLHLVYHTIAWQYFPPEAQARGTALLQAAGARATPDAPLAHLSMEADGAMGGAALTLRLWPGGELLTLGRVDFHGRWLDWQAPPPA